jgi:TolB-like protein
MVLQTLGHYRILEKLGEGGWGIVYRAHDERLDRDVALKVLSAGTLADEASRKRFRKEALTLARLNHPNIEGIYDFDIQDGVDFLVAEYVSGGTLADRLTACALSEKEVATLGTQIAMALEDAHEHGVIHRDLKPGNIAITPSGLPKVLDFGLAKLFDPSGGALKAETLTESLAGLGAAGTLPYMAPEQVQGEHVDARTDIYALGVVLYEMATARRPFCDGSTGRLIDSILHQSPVAPRAQNSRVSHELERIILKCLEKEPEQRYQSAKELAVDLRRLQAPTAVSAHAAAAVPALRQGKWLGLAGIALAAVALLAGSLALNLGGIRERLLSQGTPRIRSLAVLPLENLSRDSEQEYFADGMTEALITELSKIRALKVISRTSVMQYKGARKSLPEIASRLNVDGVIEGSVMREGDQVKITVQLIHGPTDTHLWAQDYVREMRGILALQSEVARAIANQVRAALTPAETTRLASSKPVNPEAYDLYLRGKVLLDRSENWRRASELFEQATTKDPNYASAFGALGYSLIIAHNQGQLPRSEAFPRVQQATQRAIALDPEDLDAMKAQVTVNFTILRDYQAAERIMRRILERTPNDGETHNWLGQTLSLYGRFDESVAEARRAVELDPQSVQANTWLAASLFYARRYDECIGPAHRALELGPDSFVAYFVLASCYDAKEMYNDGANAQQRAWVLYGEDPVAAAQLVTAQTQGGYRARVQFALAHALKKSEKSNFYFGDIASYYSLLGEKDQAFRNLDRAYQEYDSWIFEIQDPALDSLRGDPRWPAFLRRLNLQDTPMAKLPAAPPPAAR